MRVLFFGDIVGRSGRDALVKHLPGLKTELSPDFIVVNAENAAGGFGLTLEIANELFAAGIDCLTLGNHSWDQRTLLTQIDAEGRIIRPINYPPGTPGRGAGLYTKGGKKLLVVNVMGRLFMDPLDDPFRALDAELSKHRLGGSVDGILIDVHAEASSEKMALGHYLDGRVSFVVGTHTHVPSADGRLLPKGTAYQTDAGMCGDYNSVIGMKADPAVARFVRKLPGERLTPAEGEGTICGALVTLGANGLAEAIRPVRRGPGLLEA